MRAPPIFIVGVGRSGTSLLQSMLAAHSELSFSPETGFIRRYVAKRKLAALARSGGIGAVVSAVASDPYVTRLGIDVNAAIANVRAGSPTLDADVYDALMRAYANRNGKARYCDKDPRAVEFLPIIARHWPSAHIIHIIRDPRDVLASKKKAAWSSGRRPELHILANRLQLRLGRRTGARLFGERYHEVVYEILIGDPERTLGSLCQALGIKFEPAMLHFGEAARSLVTEEEMSWKKETLGDLLPDNSGKWEGGLTDREVALTEIICGEAFQAGGYRRSGRIKQLRLPTQLRIRAEACVLVAADRMYGSMRRLSLIPATRRR